ncbi:unnamed protein product [Ilex paraguariensis]|uniref:Myb-like protein X n=1 Tax=Ilex paraguariensis TaxID=185542 RepID=A0ABC8TIE0_9AQUA
MLRQSPSRNQKSKGIKVNHVLQICLLLAVCFWLTYQVKHSHDKKKEFDEKDAKISLNTRGGSELLRLGRKDLYPRLEETGTKNEEHDEEADEEAAGDNEENKHKEEEHEDDKKTEEKEGKGRGGGDDEIDELDQEKSGAEIDRQKDFIDEEKERDERDGKGTEEKDTETKNGQMEEGSLENHDHDEGASNIHEAREEHYKADDTSSAVTHDTQTISTENENGSSENSNEHAEVNTFERENKVNNTEEVNVGQNKTALNVEDGEIAENEILLNGTANAEKRSGIVSFRPEYGTFLNPVSDQPRLSNATNEASTETHALSLQNGTETISDFSRVLNATVGGTTSGEGFNLQTIALEHENTYSTTTDTNQLDFNARISTTLKDAEATPGGFPNSFTNPEVVASEKFITSNTSVEAEHSSRSSITGEITNATMNEMSDTSNDMDKTDETSGFSQTEKAEVQHGAIDFSDSSIPEETQVRTDLETLPELTTEGSNIEDDAAE